MANEILKRLEGKDFNSELTLSDSISDSDSDSFEFMRLSSSSSLISLSSSSSFSGDELWSEFSLSSLSDDDLSSDTVKMPAEVGAINTCILQNNETNIVETNVNPTNKNEIHTESDKMDSEASGSTFLQNKNKIPNDAFEKEANLDAYFSNPDYCLCTTCGKVFESPAALDVHKLSHVTMRNYVCKICQLDCKNREIYALHFQTHSQNTELLAQTPREKGEVSSLPYKCNTCDKIFHLYSSFKRHLDRHSLLHICHICNASFPSELLCHQHKLTHVRKTVHKCEVCGKTFQRPHQLTVHMQVHESTKSYHCAECDTSYCYKTSLMRHILKYHSPNSPKFQCHICGELFKNKKMLNGHEILHTATKLIECPDCSQTFKYRSSYHRHRVIHRGSKPFRCSACGKLYRSESDLKAHKSQHVMKDDFVCQVCDKSFAFESYLNKHMLVHEEKKRKKKNDVDVKG